MIIEILLLVSILYLIVSTIFIIKILFRLEKRISALEESEITEQKVSKFKASQHNVEDSVASGLVKGLQAIRDEDQRHLKLLEMTRKLQRTPLPVMNQNSAKPDSFDTGGDLIPANLSKEEQEILKMFYDRKNEG